MIRIERLRINHMRKPMGIDGRRQLLSWTVSGSEKQLGYQVTARGDCGSRYESGRIESDRMEYEIPWKFKNREQVEVSVLVWDAVSRDFGTLVFERGLEPEDWKADWINPEPVPMHPPGQDCLGENVPVCPSDSPEYAFRRGESTGRGRSECPGHKKRISIEYRIPYDP